MKKVCRQLFILASLAGTLFHSVLLGSVNAEQVLFSKTTLADYLQQAQSANPELKAFRAKYEAALQRIPQAAALPDPKLQITHFVESVQTRTGPQENIFMLSQSIPWFGKLESRENAASAEAEALWYEFQSRQLLLARQVATSYFDYGFTGRAIELTSENLDWLTDLEPAIEARVSGGGKINPLLRIKVEIGRLNDRLESLRQKRIAQSARLSELLGLPGGGLLPFPTLDLPKLVVPELQPLLAAIKANNPDLKSIERKIESAEARVGIARLRSYPDFTFGINYIQIGDPEVNPNTPDAGEDPWGVTASLNIPLWFTKNESSRAEALAGKLTETHLYTKQVNALEAELRVSHSLLHDADRRLKLYDEKLLGLAEQAVENSRAGYESGIVEILEVIDSERSLIDLQFLSWQAAADAWKQSVIIQTLINQPIQDLVSTEKHDE